MVRAAEPMGSSWGLLYGGRSRSSMAYLDELEEYGDRVQVVPQDELGLLDLAQAVAALPDGLASTAAGRRRCSPPSRRPAPSCRLAHFVSSGSSLGGTTGTGAKHCVRGRAGIVGNGRHGPTRRGDRRRTPSAGVPVLTSCRQGICGTCETGVVAGEPDHRDSLLSEDERQRSESMFVCVSAPAATALFSTSDQTPSRGEVHDDHQPRNDRPRRHRRRERRAVPAPILSTTPSVSPFSTIRCRSTRGCVRPVGSCTWPQYDLFAMGRYDDVHAGLTDWQTFQSAAGVGLSNFRKEEPWRPPSLLLEADPPHHDAPRHALEEILNPRQLRHLREQWYADAETLVDEILEMDEVDGAHDIAEVFPLRVFPDAVGSAEGRPREPAPLRRPHLQLLRAVEPPGRAAARSTSVRRRPGSQRSAHGRRSPRRVRGRHLGSRRSRRRDPGEAPLMVRSLLTAGVDTTVHGLGAVIHAFVEQPDQWDRLRAEPGLARVAFDEAIRLESPVQTFFRTATRDVDIDGVVIPDGHKVLLVLAAANRDPRRWVDAGPVRPVPRPVGTRRLRHGHPPVCGSARRATGGGSGPDRDGAADPAHRAGGRRRASPQQHASRLEVRPDPPHASLTIYYSTPTYS